MSDVFHSGTVALVGRPNVGKSTFLNRVLGQKLSITSPRPQTTRNRVVGIVSQDSFQAVLIDTPGHHKAWSRLNRGMVKLAEQVLEEVDVIALLVDLVPAVAQARAGKAVLSKGERVLVEHIQRSGKPCVLALNKVDAVEVDWVLPVIDAWRAAHDFAAIVPMSAFKDADAARVMEAVAALLPEGPALFPTDQLTEGSERFFVTEIIREKMFRRLRDELPYSVAVQIEQFDEDNRDSDRPRVIIYARILVERRSQKGIVIGKGGATLKAIGTDARKDIERMLGCAVHLELHVSISEDWTRNPRVLRELGIER
ncbi:MAG: GTPase Era [Alphaproteobacteria bacterium]|nr:GTPase Era [Alphaproteobacteria bacterium]